MCLTTYFYSFVVNGSLQDVLCSLWPDILLSENVFITLILQPWKKTLACNHKYYLFSLNLWTKYSVLWPKLPNQVTLLCTNIGAQSKSMWLWIQIPWKGCKISVTDNSSFYREDTKCEDFRRILWSDNDKIKEDLTGGCICQEMCIGLSYNAAQGLVWISI